MLHKFDETYVIIEYTRNIRLFCDKRRHQSLFIGLCHIVWYDKQLAKRIPLYEVLFWSIMSSYFSYK